jgi:molecular chaperone GrpE
MDDKNDVQTESQEIPHDHAPDLTEDQGELADLHTKIEELNDQLLRALADNQNVRRRAHKDVEDAHQYAITKFANDLLTVADNFDRALGLISEALKQDETFKPFIEGIELTEKELSKVFEAYGIRKHVPLNQKFDHNFHQALFDVPNNEVEAGTILQVVQSGYTLKDRLLRPAMVGVSKKED